MTITIQGIDRIDTGQVTNCEFGEQHGVMFHAWRVQHDGEQPIRMCSTHVASYIEATPESIVQRIREILALQVDDRVAGAMVGIVTRLLSDGGFDAVAVDLRTAWQAVLEHVVDNDRRMRQARLLIGSAGFALMAPAPTPGDDDDVAGW